MTFLPRIPIWQAPTGSVAGPELAAAVSGAGGMGAMGLSWAEPDLAAEMVRQTRALTDQPFQVNFALAFEPRGLVAALEAGAPVITFSWGDASLLVGLVKDAGAGLGIQVTNIEGAKRAIHLGADFLICQGIEAGGHVQSSTPLRQVLASVIEHSEGVPVIAAGGIGTAEEVSEVIAMGAKGAMLGTRFVATQESRAHADYKQALVDAAAESTALTLCFDGGWPQAAQRVVRNGTLERWEAAGSPKVGDRPGEGDIVAHSESGEPIYRYDDTAPRIGMSGEIGEMCLYAGAGVGEIRDIPSAAEVIRRLWPTSK